MSRFWTFKNLKHCAHTYGIRPTQQNRKQHRVLPLALLACFFDWRCGLLVLAAARGEALRSGTESEARQASLAHFQNCGWRDSPRGFAVSILNSLALPTHPAGVVPTCVTCKKRKLRCAQLSIQSSEYPTCVTRSRQSARTVAGRTQGHTTPHIGEEAPPPRPRRTEL